MPITKKAIHRDGTEKTFSTPSFEGTFLYFTSRGDDIENNTRGNGNRLTITNENEDLVVTSECKFIDNIFLKDGLVLWEGAEFGDTISLEIVLPANQPMPAPSINGNADLIDGIVTYITASEIPDETWKGNYYLFPFDYVVNRFVNDVMIIGNNYSGLSLRSSDAAHIDKIFKFKFTYKSNKSTPNPNIKISIILELYRYETV